MPMRSGSRENGCVLFSRYQSVSSCLALRVSLEMNKIRKMER